MKRILCALLCVVMLICIVPLNAGALTPVNNIQIDIQAPVPGQKPDYSYRASGNFEADTADDAAYEYLVNGVEWIDVTAGNTYVLPVNTFIKDHVYTVNIFLKAYTGYAFPNNAADIIASVNGSKATDFTPYINGGNATALRVGFQFAPAACTAHKWVEKVFEQATFGKDGVMKKVCSVCGEESGVSIIPRLGGCELEEWQQFHGIAYNGSNHFPYIYAYAWEDDGDVELRQGTDYTVKYPKEDKKVGKYTATVTFKGKYKGTQSVKYSVVLAKPIVSARVGENKIVLSWAKIPGAQYYRIYGYNIKTGKYDRLANTKALSYTRTGRKPGTEYAYLVRAYFINKAGKEVLSAYSEANNVYCATLCKAPVAKSTVSGKNVTLKWAKVAGASFYRVYQYNTKTKKYTTLASALTKPNVTLSKQAKGTHYYLVRAFNKYSQGSKYTTKNLTKAVVKK